MQPFLVSLWARMESNHLLRIFSPPHRPPLLSLHLGGLSPPRFLTKNQKTFMQKTNNRASLRTLRPIRGFNRKSAICGLGDLNPYKNPIILFILLPLIFYFMNLEASMNVPLPPATTGVLPSHLSSAFMLTRFAERLADTVRL